MNYLSTAVAGYLWTGGYRLSSRALSIIKISILAHFILTPAQFGLFGIAALSLSLLEILTETGINVFLLQEKGDISKYVDTAWFISIVRGLVVSTLIFASSTTIAQFFHQPAALPLVRLASLVPLIRGFINPSCVRFIKELKFRQEFFYRLAIISTESVISLSLCLLTRSPTGLIWGLVASALVEVTISFVIFSPRPTLSLKASHSKQILHRGKWITAFGIFDYIFTNGDNIIVGKILGDTALGLYQNAYKISTLPITESTNTLYQVSFPLLARMHAAGHPSKQAALKIAGLISGLSLLLSLAVYLLASPLVTVLLGPAWEEVVPTVRILAFLGSFRAISFAFNPLFMAQGKQKYVTCLTFLNSLGLLSVIVPAVTRFGLPGAAYAALFGSVLAIPPALYFALRSLRQR